jgi:hypothetical protein
MHANLYSYTSDPPKLVAVVEMKDDKVTVRTQNEHVKKAILESVWSDKGMPITAKDGKRFIKALPHIFHGSYLRAELSREE